MTATTFTPTPGPATVRTPDEKAMDLTARRGHFAWRTPALDPGEDGEAWVELSIFHFPQSGYYSASVNVTRRTPGVSAYFPLASTRVLAERGRYSRKRMQSFAADALATLPQKAPADLLAAIGGVS